MILKKLSPDKWTRLTGLMSEIEWELPLPEFASIYVAEEDGEIVGACIVQEQVHVEPIWVRPDCRKSTVGYRLFMKACEAAGTNPIYVSTNQEKVKDYLRRLGYRSLGEAFVRE